ncbi:MAG: hypothetical protein WB588_05435 [Dehalococcoidia bacterium]
MDKYEDNIETEAMKEAAKREKRLKISNVENEVNKAAKANALNNLLLNELDSAIERRHFKGKKK